jgi:hypothetical protein
MAEPLSDTARDHVEAAVFAGRKIEAIKAYREATGEGLKESKEAVEAMEVELRAAQAGRFSPTTSKGGCLPVLLLALPLFPLAARLFASRWL